jgi:ATP-dependent Clp protease ATP-binding subunit ClpC
MFERFTEAARRTLFFARFEVTQLGALEIEPHHIVLGLIREGKGLAQRILERGHVPPDALRQQIEARSEFREAIPTSLEVPFSPATSRTLQYAAEEADRLMHRYIGTEHLLLGVLREENSMGAELLAGCGLGLDVARNALIELMQVKRAEAEAGPGEELERLAQIKRWVNELARMAPDSAVARTLVRQIERELDMLTRNF